MADPTKTDDKKVVDGDGAAGDNGAGEGTPDPKDGGGKDGKSVPLATFLETEKKLKAKAQQLEVERDKLIAEKKSEKEAKLTEDGKLQELIELNKQELADMKSKLEIAEAGANEATKLKEAEIAETKTVMGDKWQDGYSILTIVELRNLRNSFSVKPPASGDNGVDDDLIKMTLTAEQKTEAHERYAFSKPERAEELYKQNLLKYEKKEK